MLKKGKRMPNNRVAKYVILTLLFTINLPAQETNFVIKSEGNIVYLKYGKKMDVKKDMYYAVFKEEEVNSESTKEIARRERIKTGTIKIIEVANDYSKAKVIKNKGIAVGDLVIESDFQYRFVITEGYSMFSISGDINTSPSPIYDKSTGMTITPYFADFIMPHNMYGAFIGVEVPKIQNTSLGSKLLFNLFPVSGDLSGFSIDLYLYWKFRLILTDKRLIIPLGIGLSMSRIRYYYPYTQYLVENGEDYLRQFLYGGFAYSGIRFQITSVFHTFLNIGFRYQDANKEWQIRYKSGRKNDVFGYESIDNIEVNSEHRAINDVKIIGLDLKLGISFIL